MDNYEIPNRGLTVGHITTTDNSDWVRHVTTDNPGLVDNNYSYNYTYPWTHPSVTKCNDKDHCYCWEATLCSPDHKECCKCNDTVHKKFITKGGRRKK